MLEIGLGSGLVRDYIKNRTAIDYRSLDFDHQLRPDIIGDVRQIPTPDDSFDLVAAFEVLEHLPFADLEQALIELKRVAQRYVVISLPDCRAHLRFSAKLPLLPRLQKAVKLPFPRRPRFKPTGPESHWWEIGWRSHSARRIWQVLVNHFQILEDFVPYENQYHHFYVLKK